MTRAAFGRGVRMQLRPIAATAVAAVAVVALGGCAPVSSAAPLATAVRPADPVLATSCTTTLNVVAHEDDDLLFINPAISEDIAAGRCVVTVFVTAGDAGRGRAYWQRREQGPMAAYAAMASAADHWVEDTIVVDGRPLIRRILPGARITLIFLRLPDAHTDRLHHRETLQRLWLGRIPVMHTLDSTMPYTRSSLIGTLSGLMDRYQPSDIRTLDYVHAYGDGDHSDHHTVGHLTYAAQAGFRPPHRLSGYLGYGVAKLPANLPDTVRDKKLAYFLAYAPSDPRVCQSAPVCLANNYAPRFSHNVPIDVTANHSPAAPSWFADPAGRTTTRGGID